MSAPNMEAITASLERSLQNCSLSHTVYGTGDASSDDSRPPENHPNILGNLELNSEISLPYQWEQRLDLQTGEIYYVNWKNGAKAKEDPRKVMEFEGNYYSEEDSYEDSDGSSSSSSPSSNDFRYEDQILVVAGCKICLMYFMLPKRVVECPKCNGLILHFDRPENGCL
ncbi:protein CURLY FLAG LEAF 1-like [Tasmannia lanceolata]|uniref:protein CURLY FLAG LEAF 1-like n=1 Tax=Tasmannia lanceolata TaxID=3420 RepID=UPI004064606E